MEPELDWPLIYARNMTPDRAFEPSPNHPADRTVLSIGSLPNPVPPYAAVAPLRGAKEARTAQLGAALERSRKAGADRAHPLKRRFAAVAAGAALRAVLAAPSLVVASMLCTSTRVRVNCTTAWRCVLRVDTSSVRRPRQTWDFRPGLMDPSQAGAPRAWLDGSAVSQT